MQVQINDTVVTIPSSLADITLSQRIDYQNDHGNQLDEMMKSILAMPDGVDKEMELVHFQLEKAFRTFGFFAGIDPEVLKESEFIDKILNIYYATLQTLMEDESGLELSTEYAWNGDLWEIHPPELKQGSKMKFGEFVDAKQMIKDMIELGSGKWEYLLPLCAIYFRKKGEAYEESFLYDGSERLQLMRSLPMDKALAVGFFLSSFLNISMSTFRSSGQAKANRANIQKNTSTGGGGQTSSNRSQKQKSLT